MPQQRQPRMENPSVTKTTKSKNRMQSFGTSAKVGYDSSAFYDRKIDGESETVDGSPSPENPVPELNSLYAHSNSMHELPDNSVHLMVTSPPYNVGKDYDEDMSVEEYRHFLREIWEETYRVLVYGGRACINGANVGRRPYLPLSALITADMIDVGFLMRGQIIWNKQASAGSSCAGVAGAHLQIPYSGMYMSTSWHSARGTSPARNRNAVTRKQRSAETVFLSGRKVYGSSPPSRRRK